MTSLIYLVALALLGQARSEVVELNCSDNATCIDNMARDFMRSLRQQKAVKLFDLFTIEPVESHARSNQGPFTKFLTSHAISFDWNDFTFRFSNPEGRDDAMDLEVLQSRSAKDDSDEVPKKSKSNVSEEEVDENKSSQLGQLDHIGHGSHVHAKPIRVKPIRVKPGKRRGSKRKVMQAVIPMLIGMKSAGIAIFGLFMVSVITIKAFMASKMALLVTVGMAMKKLYESYGYGIPETSNVLWNLARYFRFLFGIPETPLSAQSMNMPMYALPQMQDMQTMQAMQNMQAMQSMQSQMFSPNMAMPTAQ